MSKSNLKGFKVSVVMSVYNDQTFIYKAIESILSQTFSMFEFIIVDDGSTDNTLSLVERFYDDRIRLFKREHKGLATALNYGISKSVGKYIIRMDADDISLSDRIEKQVGFMEDNPDISMVGGSAKVIDSNGNIIGERRAITGVNNIKELAQYACPTIHPTLCFRKSIIEKIDGYREGFLYSQDYDLVLRMLDFNYKIDNIPKILIKYRTNKKHKSLKLYQHLKFVRLAQHFHNQRKKFNNIDNYKRNINSVGTNPSYLQMLLVDTHYKSSLLKSGSNIWLLMYYFVSLFNKDLFCVTINDYLYHKKIKKINTGSFKNT